MSLYDFYMYLKYIEHSAENLEFFIWFVSYRRTIDWLLRSWNQVSKLQERIRKERPEGAMQQVGCHNIFLRRRG